MALFLTDQVKNGKILITDGDYKHTLGAIRFLARAGYRVDAIGDPRCLSAWSKYLSRISYPQSGLREECFGDFLDFLREEKYDVLLPIGARSVKLIADHKDEIEKYCEVPIADYEKIATCLEKTATYSLARDIGINVPETWAFSSIKELEDNLGDIIFPVVVKANNEIAKDKPMYAFNKDELLDALKIWGRKITFSRKTFPIIQRYIKGNGHGFFALYQNGICKQIFMHKRIRQIPPSGGASCCAVSIYEEDLKQAGMNILNVLKWHGVAMVEFKREEYTGDLYLMEINPKFWGSLDLALASGVNFPTLAVSMAMGEDIQYSEKYQIGLRFHWPLDGEIAHLKDNLGAIWAVLRDCINPDIKSNIWLNDPMPSFVSLYREMRGMAVASVRYCIPGFRKRNG